MNKFFGKQKSFAPVRQASGKVIVSYGKEDAGNGNCTWYEVYFSTKPTIEQIKTAVLSDINAQTDEKILSGFVWKDMPVWLSNENQKNFSEAQRAGEMNPKRFTPIVFKLGENSDGSPVYHEFQTPEELTEFYFSAQNYIRQCLAEGWKRKDAIDWNLYK